MAANNTKNMISNSNPGQSAGNQPFGARGPFVGVPSSYGAVTSGDGLPITSGSNILSPNTTPSQNLEPQTNNLMSMGGDKASNGHDSNLPGPISVHRSHTTQSNNHGSHNNGSHNNGSQNNGIAPQPRLRFDYNLPKDFPFNDMPIEKSFSNDM